MCDTYTWQRPSIFIRDKPIISSERMLHKDYDLKGWVAKENLWSNLKWLGAKMNRSVVILQSYVTVTVTVWKLVSGVESVSSVSQSRVAVIEAGDISGTQRKGNVRRWKPLPEMWWRHSRLRSQAAIKALGKHQIISKVVWDCHQSLIKLARHNRVQLIWVPGHEGIVGNETADNWQGEDLNIRSQDLNQLAASQLELPRRQSGTGWKEITKNLGNPQLDSNRQRDLYLGPLPKERRIC
jgi:hypothetical protein